MPSSRESRSVEGFGIVFLEANFFKCPVIGSFSGGINEAIIEGETGYLVEENNLESLQEKIWYLYNNREKAKELGIKAYQRVINNFNWDIIIDEYIDVFKNLLGKN
jgi:phosphatidylinositol alpha-1,6-mannosyltransferase